MSKRSTARADHAGAVAVADGGFTLIEILVAIVLVGILSAVVVLGIGNLTDTGRAAACGASLDAARTGNVVYFTSHNAYTTTLLAMTSDSPPDVILPSGVTLNTQADGDDAPGTIATGNGWTLTLTPSLPDTAPALLCATSGSAPTSANGTAACPGTYSKWVGEYYADIDLIGRPALCRDDAAINFDWGGGGPGAGFPIDVFSIRWTRVVSFAAGSTTFTLGSDDGSRLFIDGKLVLDQWKLQAYATETLTKTLKAGAHTIVVEFYENFGNAEATLSWA